MNSRAASFFAELRVFAWHHVARLSIAVVTPAQFVHQILQPGGQARGFRAKALLQPFGYRFADGSAGLVIHPFAGVVGPTVHEVLRRAAISMTYPDIKSLRRKMFPLADGLHVVLPATAAMVPQAWSQANAPAAARRGSLLNDRKVQ